MKRSELLLVNETNDRLHVQRDTKQQITIWSSPCVSCASVMCFRYRFRDSSNGIRLVSFRTDEPKRDVPGAGPTDTWIFSASRKGWIRFDEMHCFTPNTTLRLVTKWI